MRARNIKPGFFKNEDLAELPALCRLLYVGLWCYSDREGRFEWRPKKIKAEIFPYEKKCDIPGLLMSLHDRKLICKYSLDGSIYGFIPNFLKHQNPHPHEASSKLPQPPTEIIEQIQCHDMSVTSREMPLTCRADSLIPDSLIPDIKKSIVVPYHEIISSLNEKTGKHYSHTTKSYQSLIRARWNEGKKLDDFLKVIDIKCSKWMTDPKMVDYCRPETLFGTKMDSYLNEADFIPTDEADRIIYELKKEREKK